MDPAQSLFNVAFSLIILLVGWWNKNIWDSIKESKDSFNSHLQTQHELKVLVISEYVRKNDFEKNIDMISKKLDKLESLEVLLANNYVTHTTFEKGIIDLLAKLDRIEGKLDKKVDK